MGAGPRCSQRGFLILSRTHVTEEFFLFPVDEAEFVLELAWLDKLGEVSTNFRDFCLYIPAGNTWLKLQGDVELCYGNVTLCSAVQSLHEGDNVFMVQLWPMRVDIMDSRDIPTEVQQVLDSFSTIFQPLQGLPPNRTHDHAIPLKEGVNIPNIRSYHYPHYENKVIEEMVREMLDSRIIKPSTSPYTSPILLVKKKDNNWRFCVDYRALNQITIPDKFPIPVIEELLEELAGASIFSISSSNE